uniref:Uncharacterized protein n=1 Tax=Physcomitrium patens TaxID=3218 RepID=A0A2K1JIP2_PHYPA|nr:hypothetical protein PHYPA_018792 [Physcomitrium patens]
MAGCSIASLGRTPLKGDCHWERVPSPSNPENVHNPWSPRGNRTRIYPGAPVGTRSESRRVEGRVHVYSASLNFPRLSCFGVVVKSPLTLNPSARRRF